MSGNADLVVGVDHGTLSGRAVVRVHDGAEFGGIAGTRPVTGGRKGLPT